MNHLLTGLLFGCCVSLLACSSSDDDDDDKGSSGSANTSSGSQQGSSGSGSTSGGTKAECSNETDCAKLTCVCGGFSGAEVQKCTNGVCATTCEQAGCR